MKTALYLTFVLLMCTLTVNAATVTVLNAKPEQCAALPGILEDLKTLPFPSDWTIFVACDSGTWSNILRRADVTLTDAALTSRAKKFTIVNGGMYTPAFSFAAYTQRTPHSVLRHELGHIVCNSHKEDVADHYADTGVCR